MAFVISEKQRTQLVVERSSKGTALDTISAIAHLPPAAAWRAGKEVSALAPGSLLPGTLIATFDKNDRPLTHARGGQVTVYLGHDESRIRTLAPDPDSHQGRWKKASILLHVGDGVRPRLNGKLYRVIE